MASESLDVAVIGIETRETTDDMLNKSPDADKKVFRRWVSIKNMQKQKSYPKKSKSTVDKQRNKVKKKDN